ncbi:MAG: hypothetical protein JNM31_01705 [Flavobacteriales bacterium]|nr:hypothetical protein [Flavobacteriales bacterium]
MTRILRLLAFIAPLSSFAQDHFGLVNSNYTGADAVLLNPARGVTQRTWLDANVFGISAFAWNDHVGLSRSGPSLWSDLRAGLQGESGRIVLKESVTSGPKQGHAQAAVHGPAINVVLGRTAIGAHLRARTETHATNIPAHLARAITSGLDQAVVPGQRYRDTDMGLLSASWSEFGASVSHTLLSRGRHMLHAGLTANYLVAHHGAAVQVDVMDYTVLDSMVAVVHEVRGSYTLADPGLNVGKGFGMDLGLVYERTMEDADDYRPHRASAGCTPMGYRYRLGVSITDMGGLSFAKGQSARLQGSSAQFQDYGSLAAADHAALDSLLLASFTSSVSVAPMRVGLPTALRMQADIRLVERFYVGVNAAQAIGDPSNLRMRRQNALAFAPRFETKRFEAAIPVVFHAYRFTSPTVGLMVRVNNFVIGSDHLSSLFKKSDLYGMDLYVRAKVMLFRSPSCKGKARKDAAEAAAAQQQDTGSAK